MGSAKLEDVFVEVASVNSEVEFKRAMLKFAAMHDCDFASISTLVDRPGMAHPDDGQVTHLPDGYMDSFLNFDEALSDPVMQFIKHSSLPLVWTQETYVAAGQGELWEHMAGFGMRAGVSVAVHMPAGRHLAVGFDTSDGASKQCLKNLARMLARLQLFAVCAIEPAFRLINPKPSVKVGTRALTRRELEVLRWTLEGKTAWEVGRILDIQERTVVMHLREACVKLDCVSKHQAVMKAVRMRLIE